MPPAIVASRSAARRFFRRLHHFDRPLSNVGSALAYHGYVQIDPINVCGRMHDLILRNRVADYREGDLMRHLHGGETTKPAETRTAFEHHLPDTGVLVAFTLEAWPHLLAIMRARSKRTGAWSGRLTPRERELVPRLLAEIAERGPLGSEHFEDPRRAHRAVWGASSLVKSTLQKLFFHGRVLIARRVNQRRGYDLPERVLPAATLAQPEAAAAETARWLALLKLRQRRLAALKRAELRCVEDAVQPIAIEGGPTLHCLREDVALLEECRGAADDDPAARPLRLLAPLDPLVYDRRVTATLWDFDYTWEAYTPPAKRVRGYYALPILAGTEIVGHVDLKAERAERRLIVASRKLRRGHALRPALQVFSEWLGL